MVQLLYSAYGSTWRAEYGEINNKPLFRFGYRGDVGWDYTAPVAWLSDLIDILKAVRPLPVGQLTKGPIFQARKRQNLHQDVVVEPRSDTSYPTQYFDLYSEELNDLILTLKDLAARIPDEKPEDWDASDRERVVLEFQRMEDELTAVGEQLGLISTEVGQVSAEVTRLGNDKVDKTTTVNGQPLSGDVVLSVADFDFDSFIVEDPNDEGTYLIP